MIRKFIIILGAVAAVPLFASGQAIGQHQLTLEDALV